MDNKIKNILNDLYKIDSSFRAHEDELIKIIDQLLAERPEVELDSDFVARLRAEVMSKAQALKPRGREGANWLSNIMNMNKFAFAAAGAAITLVVAIPLMNYLDQEKGAQLSRNSLELDFSASPKVAKLENNAFGPLAGTGSNEAPQAAGLGAGEGPAVRTVESQGIGAGGGGAAVDSKMIMPPAEMVNYEYEYTGGSLGLSESSLPVYGQNRENTLGRQVAGLVSGINLGLFDSGQLKNTQATNLQLTEDREYGYSVYYNFRDNTISISANWERWPQERGMNEPLTEAEIPDDESLFSLAGEFLRQYGISTDSYSDPLVNKYWLNQPRELAQGASMYIPEVISVIYPAKIDGQTLYDQSGRPSGMNIDINVRMNKVMSVNNVFLPDYVRSDYAAVTDSSEVIELAEKGGQNFLYQNPDADKTITLKLGAPEQRLVRHWYYDPDAGKGGSEIFIPALVFPILNKDAAPNFWRDSVVVPLVKEVFNQLNQAPTDVPEPMPLLREAPATDNGSTEPADMPEESAEESLENSMQTEN